MAAAWRRRAVVLAAAVAFAILLVAALALRATAHPHHAATGPGQAPLARKHRPRTRPIGQLAPALERYVDRETGGRLTMISFYSRALGREADYMVYLPRGYDPARSYPVFYLLHGMPGRPMAFTINAGIEVKLQALIRSGRARAMLLVFPDGRVDGRVNSDSEWANTPTGRYESYVTDVVHDVDARFSALVCRAGRAIAGLSAGAYGAANVGLHHDAMFGLIQVWSGYFLETHNGVFAHASRSVMAYNSPLDFVWTMRRTLRRFPLRIFLYSGWGDGDHDQVPEMAAALRRVGAHESWAIYPGGHSWDTWTPHVDQMLIMASRDFAHPLGDGRQACTAMPAH